MEEFMNLRFTVHHGDALEWLKTLPDNSMDSMVTDPPSGIGFMGRSWDSDRGGRDAWVDWLVSIMSEAFRVLKPGAHALVWALPRTSHWTATALEEAGFVHRDRITHLFGSGFPKNHDIAKAIDKEDGAERESLGRAKGASGSTITMRGRGGWRDGGDYDLTAPATDDAKTWDGWGTALKPGYEDWHLVQKPIEKGLTIAANVLKWSTGGLNIDGSRIPAPEGVSPAEKRRASARKSGNSPTSPGKYEHNRIVSRTNPERYMAKRPGELLGRWPANIVFSHSVACSEGSCAHDCPVAEMDRQSGSSVSRVGSPRSSKEPGTGWGMTVTGAEYEDHGGASRFFMCFQYQPKPSRAEREAGLEDLPLKSAKKMNEGGMQGRRDAKAESAIRDAEQSQGLDARGRTLIREDGSKTLVDRFIPQYRANSHPTLKSIEFMRYLTRMITPPGGTVIDPFTGSGTTGCAALLEGFRFAGSEIDEDGEGYVELAIKRMEFWGRYRPEAEAGFSVSEIIEHDKRKREEKESGQWTLF